MPHGYGVPPGSPTEKLLSAIGRHGKRPAHIHFFVSAADHRKLTTQINIEGDPLINDDFAYATRDGLVPAVIERTDDESIHANGLNGPFAEIRFDIHLTALVDGVDNQINQMRKPRRCLTLARHHPRTRRGVRLSGAALREENHVSHPGQGPRPRTPAGHSGAGR